MADYIANKNNFIRLGGRLSSDVSIYKNLKNNYVVANFTVVHNKYRKADDGSWEQTGTFYTDCKMFGCDCTDKLKKGTKVQVEGSIDTNEWEKDGKRFTKHMIIVGNISFPTPETSQNKGYSAPAQPRQNTGNYNQPSGYQQRPSQNAANNRPSDNFSQQYTQEELNDIPF